MMLTAPVPFREALRALARRDLMPTNMSSEELRQLTKDIRERSFFSARTTNADYLQSAKDTVESLLQGDFNEATARAKLQDVLDSLKYNPEHGFPTGEKVPPAEEGALRDLSSNPRIKLVLETNMRQAANAGYARQGQEDTALWAFPAWELVRIYPRRVERQNWPERWVQAAVASGSDAGGIVGRTGRMIAAKDDPIWDQLGSSALFDDGLDAPYPPFAFNSGMGIIAVERDEAIALGVISEAEAPEFNAVGFKGELDINSSRFDPELLSELKQELAHA